MYVNNKKSLAVHAVALFFALISIFSLMGTFLKEGNYTGLNIMANKYSINSHEKWGVHIFITLVLILAVFIAVGVLFNYFLNIKHNILAYVLTFMSALLLLFTILIYSGTSHILKYGDNIGAGWIVLIFSSIYTLLGSIGTIFFKSNRVTNLKKRR